MTSLANPREAAATPDTGAGRVPRHVAIIMDGNGRWAAERGLPRSEGHRRGMEAVRRTVDAAIDLGIETITLFSFSSENWSRPPAEVSFLFGLIRIFIRRDLAELHRNGVRISVIGERGNVPADIVGLIEEAETLTAGNRRLNMVVAFNYGSRGEIVRAVRRMAEDVKSGRLEPSAIDEAALSRRLDTAAIPDPDLVIRTSGEMRLSNFLLWESAYSEFFFTETLWPDFTPAKLEAICEAYTKRERRHGK